MIIGISGKARSGKDTFATTLSTTLPGVVLTAFAVAVKREVGDFLTECRVDWEPDHLYGEQEDKECNLVLRGLDEVLEKFPEFRDFTSRYGDHSWFANSVVFTPRALMQWWGTEYRRAQNANYWVDQVLQQVCTDPDSLYLVTDVRFPNEAGCIRKAGGFLVRIERPDGPTPSNPDHPSETSLDDWEDWDAILVNDSTLTSFKDACWYLGKTLLEEMVESCPD